MRTFISFITTSLLLIASLALGQTTTIRDGSAPGTADVMGSAPAGTEQGLVTRPIMPTVTITGSVTANQGAAHATENWGINLRQINGSTISLGQAVMSSSFPVVISSNQSAIPSSQSGAWSITANAGTNLNTSALLLDATFTGRTPSALVGGRFDINAGSWLGSTAPTVGQKTMANSLPVTMASDQVVAATMANDGACPSGAANFTVASLNASRKKAYLMGSPANTDYVFVKFGVTATSSDFRLAPGQPLNELINPVWQGQIDAIPASGTQAVCIMEFN